MSRVCCAFALLLAACGTVGYEVTAESDSNVATDAQPGVTSDAQFACGGAGIIVCEDFETDLSKWVELADDGRLSLDTDEARAGQALQVSHAGTAITMLQYVLPEFETLYARSWIRVAPGTDFGDWTVFMEVRQDPHVDEKISFDGVLDNRLQVVGIANTTNASSVGPPGTLPRGEWFCAELFIVPGTPGIAWVQANGTRVELGRGLNLAPSSGRFDTFLLGIATSGISLDASIDDVVVSTTNQGCGP